MVQLGEEIKLTPDQCQYDRLHRYQSYFTFGDPGIEGNVGLTTTQDFFLTVPVNNDTIIEQTESFSLILQDVNGAFIGTDTQVAFITDNDGLATPPSQARGTIKFEFDSYNTVEGQGFVDLRVIRVGGQNRGY
jgi:hypothetical protein